MRVLAEWQLGVPKRTFLNCAGQWYRGHDRDLRPAHLAISALEAIVRTYDLASSSGGYSTPRRRCTYLEDGESVRLVGLDDLVRAIAG
jgi:hypothetical protein